MRFDTLAEKIRAEGRRKIVVVAADEEAVLTGVAHAAHDGLADPILIGDGAAIRRIAEAACVDVSAFPIEDIADPTAAALAAMAMVRDGTADAVMKGKISTPDLMRVGLKNGLRKEGRLLSHIALFELKGATKLFMITDGGVVPMPTLEQRVLILKNAVDAMRALGVDRPKIAGLSSTEFPDEKIPSSVAMAELKTLYAPQGPLDGFGVYDGPLDLSSALDAHAAKVKGLGGEVVGNADILHCPDVVAGNLLGKAIARFSSGARIGGCVVGAAVPIVLLSRASSREDKYCSIVAALACGR